MATQRPGSIRRRPRGFTATEMLMTVAILAIVGSLGPELLLQINKFFILSRTRIELQRQARVALLNITRNIRQAQSSTILIDRASGQPYYSRIKFTKKQGDVITYYQDGRKLRQIDDSNTSVLAEDLRYLVFSFPRSDDMTIVSVAMTYEKIIYQGKLKALHVASERVRVMNE